MNISNASCEYFYDEEYDVAKNEGTYNQPFLSSFNNNCYPCSNISENHINPFEHDFLTTSRLWSACLLENSQNNNYDESCDHLESNIFKCVSTDNVIDSSRYALSRNLPGENSFNYRLYFEKADSIGFKGDFDIRKQFAKKYNSKVFIDSGKCSAATSDSLIHPFKHYRNELANSENNLNETSQENRKEISVSSHRKKASKQLWRKLKSVFSLKGIRWKKEVTTSTSTRFSRSYSAPCLKITEYYSDECERNNRFSTTVVELYNLLTDLTNDEVNDTVFLPKGKHSRFMQTTGTNARDASSQCPELVQAIVGNSRRARRHLNVEYPGLGVIKLPHQVRTSISHFIGEENSLLNLKFLENAIEIIPKDAKRSRSVNRIRRSRAYHEDNDGSINMDKRRKSHEPTRCVSESRHRYGFKCGNTTEKDNHRTFIHDSSDLMIIEENKSLSFSDLRPIPKKWGLSNGDEMLAIFDFNARTPVEPKHMEYDEESSLRIGGLVTNAIAAIKLVSESISTIKDLATVCDMFVRCKDSNRQSTSALLLAVDSILALISDGLSIDSLRSKKTQPANEMSSKLTLRMWMFIEESCRSNLLKDVSHKLAFANLLKHVKQACGNTVPDQRSKEWLAQLKLQIFVVIAIKNNILHIWLRAVVINDTILHRFFATCSFFQQARTSYSNALSAVIVEIRRLSVPGNCKLSNISKPVKPNAARTIVSRTVSNSSSDNSISKSRIPRPNKLLTKAATKY